MRPSFAYRPDIDGLRAVAIFAVVIYHLGKLSKGGFIGVDVFFVISGYLITSIILSDMEAGRFSIASFYERRIRRIFPALFACLAATTIGGYFLMFPAEFVFLAKSVLAATFFVANLFYAETAGYFQAPTQTLPLIHTWSLAVEEQFYLLFPLALILLARFGNKATVAVLTVTAFASLVWSEVLVRTQSDAAYYPLAPRGFELLIGSLLAFGSVPEIKTQKAREVLSAFGLLAILIPTFAYNKTTPFPGLCALVPSFGAAALIHTGRLRDTFASKLLSSRPFVSLGLISYSLYLWHVPIITFYHLRFEQHPRFAMKIALTAVSVAAAYLSWRFVEQPFRTKAIAKGRRQVFTFGAVTATGVAVMAVAIIHGNGWKERFAPEIRQLASFTYNPAGPMRNGTCFMSRAAARISDFQADRCLALDVGKKNVLIVGDSHAAHLWAGFSKTFPDVNFLQATASGCSAELVKGGFDRCRKVMSTLFDEFLPGKQLDAIIFAMNWPGKKFAMNWPGKKAQAAMRAVDRLRPHARQLYLFGPIVRYTAPLPRLLTMSKLYREPGLVANARQKNGSSTDAAFRRYFKDKGIRYISVIDAMCRGESCSTVDEHGVPLQFDTAHLTAAGSAWLVRQLTDQLMFDN